MYKLTNDTKISLPIAVWLAHDSYDYDDRENVISVTSLLKPTRMIVLGKKFVGESKTVDIENLIASSMGTALHDSVEFAWRHEDTVAKTLSRLGYENPKRILGSIQFEKRSEMEFGHWIVSGKFDIVFAGFPMDVKSTTVYGWIYDSNAFEHKFQLSAYKKLNPDIITKDVGYIEYIFTDWSKQKARADRQYPQSRVATKEVELFTDEEITKLIEDKLHDIDEQLLLSEPELRDCSNEELWATPDTWKYYAKPTAKRATKNFDNPEEAQQRMVKDGNKGKIEFVAGTVKRCKYCQYTEICSQYKRMKEEGRNIDE